MTHQRHFDAGCSYASAAQLDTPSVHGDDYVWIVPDDAETNVAAAR